MGLCSCTPLCCISHTAVLHSNKSKSKSTKLYRIYWLDWSGYPSKRLYVKRTGHETHDKIATITGATLGLQSN